MKALITGVGGFCGPHLIARLRRISNVEVFGIDRTPAPRPQLDTYVQCDVTQPADVERAIGALRPDWIFHLASLAGNGGPSESIYRINLIGTVNLLESVRRFVPECRVLLAGSFAEYGAVDAPELPVTEEAVCHPIGAYGISKYGATLTGLDYVRRLGLRVVVVRPSNIIGPGVQESLVVGAMLARAKNALASANPVMKVGDFDSERDFVGVTDVMDAYVRLAQSDASGEIFNVCSGTSHSIRKVAEMLVANSARPIKLDFDANLVANSAIRRLYGSYEKAKRAVGFYPETSIEEILKSTWRAEMEPVCESRC